MTEKIVLGVNLRQNKNSKSSAYGKYYPEVDQQQTLSLRGFAQHMVDHGCLYTRNIVEGVLNQICNCLPEVVSQGVGVKLGSLGTFYPTAQVKKNGAVGSILAMEGLNPNDVVKGIHIRFRPSASKLDNLSSSAFKDNCSLELRNIVDTQEMVVNGKSRKYQILKPILTAVAEAKGYNGNPEDDDPSTGSGQGNGGSTGGDNTAGGGGFNGNPEDDTQSGGNSGNSGSSGSTTTSVAAPVISDDANITANGTVHVTCATDGASMYYTVGMDSDPADPTNQSTPVPANGTIVANESYSEDAHLKVIAYKDGVYSTVASKTIPARQDD